MTQETGNEQLEGLGVHAQLRGFLESKLIVSGQCSSKHIHRFCIPRTSQNLANARAKIIAAQK